MQRIAGAAALAVLGCPAVRAQAAGEDRALEARLRAIAAEHQGKIALYAAQLNTGRTVALDADVPVQTASVIKLAILYEAMEQIRAGKAHWEDKVVLKPGDAVSGSGLLLFFDAPQELTFKDILTLMVILSDNTAANLAIDKLGLDAVNARIAWMGLKNTHLYKKIGKPSEEAMPADQPRFGLGKTTAREMAAVMERIGRCELDKTPGPVSGSDRAICRTALHMLRNQFYRDTIPRYLETMDTTETGLEAGSGSGIASKTGSLNAVRNDVAIVAGKSGPMVLSIFTYDNKDTGWTADNEAELTIARLAKAIVEAWSPKGIDGRALVPGLGLGAAAKDASAASKR